MSFKTSVLHHKRLTAFLFSIITAVALLLQWIPACASRVAESEEQLPVNASVPELKTFADLSGRKVAMLAGVPFEELVREKVPDVAEIQYFNTAADMQLALKSGKVDALFFNNAVGTMLVNQDSSLAMFPERLGVTDYGFAFAKGSAECIKWQTALDIIGSERVGELWNIWLGADESRKILPAQTWAGANGTLKVASCDKLPPMSYVGDSGRLTGFDIAVMLEIAQQLDIHLDFTGMEFSSVLAEVHTGKAQVANGCIVINDERSKLVDFVPYHEASYVLIVRSEEQETPESGFWKQVMDSFERTFVTDSRWKMILSGLFLTVMIAVCSGVLGTLLGYGLVFLRHKDHPMINRLIAVYSSLITGIPVVVILMVLYYVIFGKLDMSAPLVAILGFSMIFGARAYGLIQNAVNAVDAGQREAALALGCTENLTFRKVILPQAKNIYLPSLRTQFVMLLKETSIAGYITVLEMTRAVDLVRSRTMDAFFPLITAAAIYFLLTLLLTKLITAAEKLRLKNHEQRKIKGVD